MNAQIERKQYACYVPERPGYVMQCPDNLGVVSLHEYFRYGNEVQYNGRNGYNDNQCGQQAAEKSDNMVLFLPQVVHVFSQEIAHKRIYRQQIYTALALWNTVENKDDDETQEGKKPQAVHGLEAMPLFFPPCFAQSVPCMS